MAGQRGGAGASAVSTKAPTAQLQTIIGPFLSNLGFTVDEVDTDVNKGGRKGPVIYYRGKDCKIQIFH